MKRREAKVKKQKNVNQAKEHCKEANKYTEKGRPDRGTVEPGGKQTRQRKEG